MSCKSASIYTSAKLLSTSISCSNDRPWFECVKQESRSNRSLSISHNQIIISGCCKKFAVTSLPVTGQHMLQIHRCCKIFATFLRFKSLIKWEKPPCLYIMRSWQVKYVESMCPRPLETGPKWICWNRMSIHAQSRLSHNVFESHLNKESLSRVAVRKFLEKNVFIYWKDITIIAAAHSEEIKEAYGWQTIPTVQTSETSAFRLCLLFRHIVHVIKTDNVQ